MQNMEKEDTCFIMVPFLLELTLLLYSYSVN